MSVIKNRCASTGVGRLPTFCGAGVVLTAKSAELSPLSFELPSSPPGSRSMEVSFSGTGAGLPSVNSSGALPHPTLSTTLPPGSSSARPPPVVLRGWSNSASGTRPISCPARTKR